ncbi:MAG: hypothetical protein SF051_01415 [Elusimicrobiota bacterium]|nr:hypothetical protein [Elusimicrobiota bacterium]
MKNGGQTMTYRRFIAVALLLASVSPSASATAIEQLLLHSPTGTVIDVPTPRGAPARPAAGELVQETQMPWPPRYNSPATYESRDAAQAALSANIGELRRGGYIVLESDVVEFGCGGAASPFAVCYGYWIDFVPSVRPRASAQASVQPAHLTLEGGDLVEYSDRRYDSYYEARQEMERVRDDLRDGGYVIRSARVIARADGYRYRIAYQHNPL